MENLHVREKGKLREPKTCRIFFSSPFGGMEEEREELTRKYFPQIQHACNAKGVQFVAVDMRWGITSQAAENAQVINICLREIDRSDIFVGFFGQRYGWHGADDKQLQENFDNAVRTYAWLDGVRDRSVTELEFLHGHLNQPGILPACICFRDKAYDDVVREEGLKTGDKKQVFKYSSESDHATEMMDDLKDRVKQTENKCLGVDMAYPHPHVGARFMFETIWPYLTDVLLANVDEGKATKREQQRTDHDAFRARHTAVYYGGQQYLDFLNTKLAEGQGSVLVTGPAGSGKSALLSNWTVQLEADHPDVAMVFHFVGCAPGTTGASDILSRLLSEVTHVLGRDDSKGPEDKKENAQDIQHLQMQLLGAMEKLVKEKQKQVVVVLDGLNRSLRGGKTSKHLYWLPESWPPGVLFVASTVVTDTDSFDLLVKERSYQTVNIEPLDELPKQEISVRVLKKSGKELAAEQLDRVVASGQTSNPLFLRLVLSELSIFGYFRLLDKKIDSLISCPNVGELLQKIFFRLEEDYNGKEENRMLVQEALCAIELSHSGLLERELMEMLRVESHIWVPLFFAMEGLLVSHSGLLRFAFAEISQAVRTKYLQNEEEKKQMMKRMIKYFDMKLQSIPVWEELMTPLSKRPVDELPWLQLAVGDLDGLSNTLLNIFTLQRMQEESKYEFFELWKATQKNMLEICKLYEPVFDLAVADLYLHQQDLTFGSVTPPPGVKLRPLLKSLRDLYNMASYPEGAVKVLQRDIDVLLHVRGTIPSEERFKLMMETSYALACALVDCGHFDAGEKSHLGIMDSCNSFLEEHPEDPLIIQLLGFISNGVGVVRVKQRRWNEAITMFEQSLKHHQQLDNKASISDAYCNIGMTHMENGDPEKGLPYMLESLQMCNELYFGHLPLEIGNLLTNIGLCYRRLGDLDNAETMYNRSLQVKANAVGWDHDVVALAYMNLSALCMHRQDFAKAEEHIRKSREIMEGNGATLDSKEYRQSAENLMCCLLSQGKLEEILPLYLPLFHKMCELNEMDHGIPSIHREIAKYFLHIGDPDTAREISLVLINSKVRDVQNYIFLDHLQLMKAPEQRPHLPEECTLDYAVHTVWPGNTDLTRRIIEYHLLPADDIDGILQLMTLCVENNRQWEDYNYQACADWCTESENMEAAVQVLEAGVKEYPQALDLRLRLMDLCRKMQAHSRAYPHLPEILEGKKDDPATQLVAGDIAMRSSDFQMALDCFDRVSGMGNEELADMARKCAEALRKSLAENSEDASATGNGISENSDAWNPENGEKERKNSGKHEAGN